MVLPSLQQHWPLHVGAPFILGKNGTKCSEKITSIVDIVKKKKIVVYLKSKSDREGSGVRE